MSNTQSSTRKWLVRFAIWYLKRQVIVDLVVIGVAAALMAFGGWYE